MDLQSIFKNRKIQDNNGGKNMIEIFLEAPIELQLIILGAIGAFIVVAYYGVRGTDEAIKFNNRFNQDEKWRNDGK